MENLCRKCSKPGAFTVVTRPGRNPYRRSICNDCLAARRRAWRKGRGETGRAVNRKYMRGYWRGYRQRSPDKVPGTFEWAVLNPEKCLFNRIRDRACKAGKADRHMLRMTYAEFLLEIGGKIPRVCPILGIPLAFSRDPRADGIPSVDRVDNSRPYERGNIAVISLRANLLKRDGSVDEFRRIAEWMQAQTAQNERLRAA